MKREADTISGRSYTQALSGTCGEPTIDNRRTWRKLTPWVGTAVFAVSLQVTLTTRYDRQLRGAIDPWLDEVPAIVEHPFSATRTEQTLKRRYQEPNTSPRTPTISSVQIPAARPRPEALTDALLLKAQKFYDTRCASCHGSKGDGKGPAAEMIKPVPRNFLDDSWQKSTTDESIYKAILKGGQAVGKSYMMPPTFDLNGRPEMISALVFLIRTMPEHP